MYIHDATEQAYKNGYAAGLKVTKDIFDELKNKLFPVILKEPCFFQVFEIFAEINKKHLTEEHND